MKKFLILLCLLGCMPNRPMAPIPLPNGRVVSELEDGQTLKIRKEGTFIFALKSNASPDYFWAISALEGNQAVIYNDKKDMTQSIAITFNESGSVSFTYCQFTDVGITKLKTVKYTIQVEG